MNKSNYYEELKTAARDLRGQLGFSGARILRSDLRRIYNSEGIEIDLWPPPGLAKGQAKLKNLRGAYFSDDDGISVMIARNLPDDPKIFTMAHELKHHFFDRDQVLSLCGQNNEHEAIEIGAEVFAAELIFPEENFRQELVKLIGERVCKAEDIVRLKRETQTTLSYAGLVKRAERLGFVRRDAFASVRWKKLEESIYGEPLYKQIQRRRKAKKLRYRGN